MKRLISMYFFTSVLNTINPRIRPRIDCCKTHLSVRSPLTPHSKQYTQFVGVQPSTRYFGVQPSTRFFGVQPSTRLFGLSTNAIRPMFNYVRISLCWCSFSCHHFFSRVVGHTYFKDCSRFGFVLKLLQIAMLDLLWNQCTYYVVNYCVAFVYTSLQVSCSMNVQHITWAVERALDVLSVMIFSMNSV